MHTQTTGKVKPCVCFTLLVWSSGVCLFSAALSDISDTSRGAFSFSLCCLRCLQYPGILNLTRDLANKCRVKRFPAVELPNSNAFLQFAPSNQLLPKWETGSSSQGGPCASSGFIPCFDSVKHTSEEELKKLHSRMSRKQKELHKRETHTSHISS